MISGASIAIAAVLLILPGFITDTLGFILLFPVTRKLLINTMINKKNFKTKNHENNIIDAEIIEEEKKDKDKDEL